MTVDPGTSLTVVAVTEAVKHLLPKQVEGWVTIAVAVAIGLILGTLGVEGLSPLDGVVSSLVAVGSVKLASSVGGK